MIKFALSLVGIEVLAKTYVPDGQLFAIECGLKGVVFLVGFGFVVALILMGLG